jgi:hypothetical protein
MVTAAPSLALSSTASTTTYQVMSPLDGSVSPRKQRWRNEDLRQHECFINQDLFPRLYSLDRRRRRRGMDPDLQALANVEAGLPLIPNLYTSYQARNRQRAWFVLMALISIFPFISVLVYREKFDPALSWYTKGEIDSLTPMQKQIIKAIMITGFILWPFLLFYLIWQFRTPAGMS